MLQEDYVLNYVLIYSDSMGQPGFSQVVLLRDEVSGPISADEESEFV